MIGVGPFIVNQGQGFGPSRTPGKCVFFQAFGDDTVRNGQQVLQNERLVLVDIVKDARDGVDSGWI